MTLRIRSTLIRILICAALAAPAAAQMDPPVDARPRIGVGVEMGFAALDPRHTINTTSLFLTPGVEAHTRGRVFVFAGVRMFVPVLPISGSGGERVTDEDGNQGFRDTGGLGYPWLRAGAGASLTDSPRSPTVTVAVGSLGLGPDAHPWVGGAAGVPLRGAWRLEAEVGWDRNWVKDTFFITPPQEPTEPFPRTSYSRRTEEWFRTAQLGVRYRL